MNTPTLLPVPYFAPEEQLPGPLPTFEEILAGKEADGYDDPECVQIGWKQVNRVGEHFVVKFGAGVNFLDGQNLNFVKNNTSIRVPALYAMYEREHEGKNMLVIVMEAIAGMTLEQKLPDLDAAGREAITMQLRACFDQLRGIPSPDYYRNIARQPDDFEEGPFTSAEAASHNNVIHCFLHAPGSTGPPVFTHGSLHVANVIVQPDGAISIIDWEDAGFYQAYIEYLGAIKMEMGTVEWKTEMIPGILDSFPEQLKLVLTLREEFDSRDDEFDRDEDELYRRSESKQ
ncbi:Uu.00g056130.m01.CDS01 [Anthostomella pinea]|uniref:Uu.00g056130.m01.CDS01 n=1 Tax=Anthostomella pinea TaxID=933095 RepID=A0AAI8VRG9_9PEZI|nr:Uu.00g056130.m01.CDS01 [Anthostomella pinea]